MSFGSSSSSNDAIIAEQKKQAEEERRKEALRQARLTRGKGMVDAIFNPEGGEAPGMRVMDWQTYDPNATYYLPDGTPWSPDPNAYKTVQQTDWVTNTPWANAAPGMVWNDKDSMFVPAGSPSAGKARGHYVTHDAQVGLTPEMQFAQAVKDGTLYTDPAQTYSGIGNDFYDTYRQGYLDYYMPQLEDRYQEARSQNLYNLARRGILRSTAATDAQSKLTKNRLAQEASLYGQADNATAGVKNQIADAKRQALQLLYQTEDPTSAANTALTEVNAVQSQKPDLNPLGDIFAVAASAYQNYADAERKRRYANAYYQASPFRGQSSGTNYG